MDEKIVIRTMTIEDYDKVYALWTVTEGMGLSEADSPANIAKTLARNPGLSLVAEQAGEIVGSLLCGHDGRRGCLYHLAVSAACRRAGIGRALVEGCLAGLQAEGIGKCHVFVFPDNQAGRRFWQHIGLSERDDVLFYSQELS